MDRFDRSSQSCHFLVRTEAKGPRETPSPLPPSSREGDAALLACRIEDGRCVAPCSHAAIVDLHGRLGHHRDSSMEANYDGGGPTPGVESSFESRPRRRSVAAK